MKNTISPEKIIRDAMNVKARRAKAQKLTKREKQNAEALKVARRFERYLEAEQKKRLSSEEKLALLYFSPGAINRAKAKGRGSLESRERTFAKEYGGENLTDKVEALLKYASPGAVARVLSVPKRQLKMKSDYIRFKKKQKRFTDVEVMDASGVQAWYAVANVTRGRPMRTSEYERFFYETQLYYMVDTQGIFSSAFNGVSCPPSLGDKMYKAARIPTIKQMLFELPGEVSINPFRSSEHHVSPPLYFWKNEVEECDERDPDYETNRIYYVYVYETDPEFYQLEGEIYKKTLG